MNTNRYLHLETKKIYKIDSEAGDLVDLVSESNVHIYVTKEEQAQQFITIVDTPDLYEINYFK